MEPRERGANDNEWGGLVYHAGSLYATRERQRTKRFAFIKLLLSGHCLVMYGLGGGSLDRALGEHDSDAWVEIRRSVLVAAYLYPGAKEEEQALRIANELKVPAFVVYEEREGGILQELLGLPNVRGQAALTGDMHTSEQTMLEALDRFIHGLRQEIRSNRKVRNL